METGCAYAFVRSPSGWVQQARLVAAESSVSDYFGCSVAIDGDTAIVGAWRSNNYVGTAYIFFRNGSTWTEQAKLTASDGISGDNFGCSVSVHGDTALVGAFGKDQATGAAYIFTRRDGVWTEQAKLTASDRALNDAFSYSVSVGDDTAVVGAYRKNDFAGVAYVFERSGSAWMQKTVLTGEAAYGLFGYSVSVDGSTIVIGSYGANDNAGAAVIFTRSGATWSRQAVITQGDPSGTDAFGWSVSVKGDTVMVGAPGKNDNTGAAYAFVRSGTAWRQQARLTASDGATGDAFGWSVGCAGDTVVAGAYAHNSHSGAAYAYR
jgi:hypothetical protein